MSKPTNSGVIVALLPDETYVRTRPTIDDHHLTVAFIGRYDDEDITPKALRGYWEGLTNLWVNRIECEVTAQAMFDTPDGWAHVDLIDGPLLPSCRSIVEDLLPVYGLPMDTRHGFLPHITRRYIKHNSSGQIELVQRRDKLRFTLNRLALWAGDTRFETELL